MHALAPVSPRPSLPTNPPPPSLLHQRNPYLTPTAALPRAGSRPPSRDGLLHPPRSGRLPSCAPVSFLLACQPLPYPALHLPFFPHSGRLPPRAPAAFLPALRPPSSSQSVRLPARTPSTFLPEIRPPSPLRSHGRTTADQPLHL
ncbi:hypothetical protein VPH35_078129 [Triticum aestivum]